MKKICFVALAAVASLSAYAVDYSYTFTSPNGSLIANTTAGMAHGTAYTWGLSGTTYGSDYSVLKADVATRGYEVKSASLKITGIYDSTGETTDPKDALYINILGGLAAGYSQKVFDTSGQTAGDFAANWSAGQNPFSTGSTFNSNLRSATYSTGTLAFQDATADSLLTNLTTGVTTTGTPSDISWSDPDGPATASTLVFTFTGANMDALESLLRGVGTVGLGFGPECHYYDTGITLYVTTTSSVPDSGVTAVMLAFAFVGLIGFRRSVKL